jgi:hypothetical protein
VMAPGSKTLAVLLLMVTGCSAKPDKRVLFHHSSHAFTISAESWLGKGAYSIDYTRVYVVSTSTSENNKPILVLEGAYLMLTKVLVSPDNHVVFCLKEGRVHRRRQAVVLPGRVRQLSLTFSHTFSCS